MSITLTPNPEFANFEFLSMLKAGSRIRAHTYSRTLATECMAAILTSSLVASASCAHAAKSRLSCTSTWSPLGVAPMCPSALTAATCSGGSQNRLRLVVMARHRMKEEQAPGNAAVDLFAFPATRMSEVGFAGALSPQSH